MIVRPIEFIVGDRATLALGDPPATKFPVEDTVRSAVETWVGRHLPHLRPSEHLRIRPVLAPASAELRAIYGAGERELEANDTSAASGYAPLTPTEELVLAVERYLNGPEFKAAFPDTGEDVKVFGLRRDGHVSLTVAMPFRCEAIASEAAYFARKEAVLGALVERFRAAPLELAWSLNSLDRPGRGADGTYLTLTGTSAEDADSGQVGRGNRVNGLIAFARPAGSEAAPGKNPVAHPGKLYSVLSQRLAREIHARCPGLREVYVHLATRIGEPVDRPWTGRAVGAGGRRDARGRRALACGRSSTPSSPGCRSSGASLFAASIRSARRQGRNGVSPGESAMNQGTRRVLGARRSRRARGGG